ncbi:MAG: CotH kinase family protein [Lachnospiraceae bacterium]|nr:CotH kinase family protein [Lachnospiraceae bacterium]
MQKKLLSILLALTMTFGLAGCAVNSNDGETSTAEADYSTEIFGKDVITINITTSEEDWDYLTENATSKPYISADVEIDGLTYEDVGIKTKGNTSLTQVANSGSDRYSLKINFDKYVDGQDCYGLDSLVLNNLYSDTTYLKEYMSYTLMDYMDIPSSLYTFADIYVNGEHYGFFLALEDVDENFLERNYGEDYTGEAYKPESMDMEDNGGDMGGGDNVKGGNIGNMSFDITSLFTLTDSTGNEIEWSSVLPDGFDASAVATVTYADGSTTDFSMRELMSADLSGIAALTNENGVTVDISAYTLSMSANMPQADGGMQRPGGQASGDSQTNDRNEATQIQGSENAGGGMQNPGNGGKGMDGGSLGVNLVYTDDEISSYSNIFDNAITDVDEEDETRLIETLKAISEGENLEDYINVDEVLRYAAVNVFLVNLDSYFSNMGHNYCLYEDDGQLSMIPWDYNLSFGTYSSSNASDAINYAIDTVFSGVSAEDRPIIGLLLENEEYLEHYHEYLSELVEYVTSGQFDEKVDAVSSVIDSYVQNDTTSFDGYDAFKTGVEALKTFASLRAESVSGQLDGSIPSTEEEQADSDALIDASVLNLSELGAMGGGNHQGGNDGFGGGGMPSRGDQETMPFGEATSAPGSDDSQNP